MRRAMREITIPEATSASGTPAATPYPLHGNRSGAIKGGPGGPREHRKGVGVCVWGPTPFQGAEAFVRYLGRFKGGEPHFEDTSAYPFSCIVGGQGQALVGAVVSSFHVHEDESV